MAAGRRLVGLKVRGKVSRKVGKKFLAWKTNLGVIISGKIISVGKLPKA